MVKPDYNGGSIANLMSSIASACNGKTPYANLRGLDINEIKNSRNIILLVFDGLGYNYVMSHKDSFMASNMKGKMTSVFPSTTASAVTTFLSGLPPQQNGMIGWFVYLKELGSVSPILRYCARGGSAPFNPEIAEPEKLINVEPFSSKIRRNSYILTDRIIAHSNFNSVFSKGSKTTAYREGNMHDMFRKLEKIVKSKEKKYVYAYWPCFDAVAHDFGVKSAKTRKHFKEINKRLKKFMQRIRGSDTTLIITADHGHLDVPKNKVINISKDHPKLYECLSMPLSGDVRAACCYVKLGKERQFLDYMRTKFKDSFDVHKSSDILKRNFYGLGKPNPKLSERVGDYIVISKGEWVFIDRVMGEKEFDLIGNHSGLSKDEMLVPLIILRS